MRRLRLHLSTALILVLSTGVLMWLNTRARVELWYPDGGKMLYQNTSWGWPFTALVRFDGPYAFSLSDGVTFNSYFNALKAMGWRWGGVTVDAVTGAVLLLGVAVLCEWRIAAKARQ